MKNKKAVILEVKMFLKIGVIDKIHLLFIGIMIYFSSLHKALIGYRGWLTLSGSMVSVSVMSLWFTPVQECYSPFFKKKFKITDKL